RASAKTARRRAQGRRACLVFDQEPGEFAGAINLFEQEHPFIRVKLLNGSAVQTMTRINSEYGAKNYLFDITHIRGLFLLPLRKKQIIAAYRSPYRDALRPGYKDDEGYFNAIFTQGQLFILNKNLVKPQDYPKSLEELLTPKWRKELGM